MASASPSNGMSSSVDSSKRSASVGGDDARASKRHHHIGSSYSTKVLSLFPPDEAFLSDSSRLCRCINALRCIGAELPQLANSGHPGAPMGCSPMAYVLFGQVMRYSPADPLWFNRDRFILSNGHACALLYSLMYLTGYASVTKDDLRAFRKLGSRTPGHPESFMTAGVEVCTGPLGQGLTNGVGMAIASHHLSKKYNQPGFDLFHSNIYVICGDGCLQEGVTSEASSLAGHLGLGRLIVLYDDNRITIDGNTNLAFTEDVVERYKAYGWHVQVVDDGDSVSSPGNILRAIRVAQQEADRPSLIKIRTTIGYGSTKQGTEKTHGAPLGVDDLKKVKAQLGQAEDASALEVEEDVLRVFRGFGSRGDKIAVEWRMMFDEYCNLYPEKGEEITRRFGGVIPEDLLLKLQSGSWDCNEGKPVSSEATRMSSSRCLNLVASYLPEVVGGSADLSGSNMTLLKGETDYQRGNEGGRYIRFGIREHAMAGIANGLCAFGGFRPFAATFLNFITYAWGAVRLSALGRCGVLYIATHDSIELGEDGPTHQPIETIPLIRATPNILLIRPADARETCGSYHIWLMNPTRPSVLALCRSNTPQLDGSSAEKSVKGAYVVDDFEGQATNTDLQISNTLQYVVLAASGTEVHICAQAKTILAKQGLKVRVVSMPCWDIFQEQEEEYQQHVLLTKHRYNDNVLTTYVEAAATLGWDKYFDLKIGIDSFGASGTKKDLYQHFGLTPELITQQIYKRIHNRS